MKETRWIFSTLLLVILTACVLHGSMTTTSYAATANYSEVVTGIQTIPLQLSGQYTTTTAAVVKFQLPFKAQVLGVSATARASGGTSPTLTVDVQEGGTTILSSPISITAATVAEGTVSDSSLADESTITVDLAIGGSSPTWDDITVLVTVRRTN